MWEVFNTQDNEVLKRTASLQEADEFIASVQDDELRQGMLQAREVDDKPKHAPRPKLVVVRGYPGSGKTHYASTHFPGIFHVENDMYFMRNGEYSWSKDELQDAIKWCISMVKNALERNIDVVVANTFTKKRYIEAYKWIAEEYGADFEVHRCIGEYKNVHGLNGKLVQQFKDSMEDWPGEFVV